MKVFIEMNSKPATVETYDRKIARALFSFFTRKYNMGNIDFERHGPRWLIERMRRNMNQKLHSNDRFLIVKHYLCNEIPI